MDSVLIGCQVVIVVAYVALSVDGIVESSFFLGVSVHDAAIVFADDVVWKVLMLALDVLLDADALVDLVSA
eukprot:6301670-Amphidinium_carterae.1